ncbi:MAG: SirB1 family protein [Alphaproteobacteria bacterium]
MTDAANRLEEIATDESRAWPIGEAALLLAALDHPGRDIDAYIRHLGNLAEGIGKVESSAARADMLATNLHVEQGYRGDSENYDDMANANLMSVIDRRRGLPVALAILYIETARRAGWPAWGLDLPGHFVLRIDGQAAGDWTVIDPFHGGIPVETGTLRQMIKTYTGPGADLEPRHMEPMADRDVLLRLLNNIRGRALQAEDAGRGLEIMDRMLLIAPREAGLWLESAAIRVKLGQLMGAREAVDRCMALEPDRHVQAKAERLLGTLRRDLN